MVVFLWIGVTKILRYARSVSVLCIRTDRQFCPIQHSVIGFYNRDGKCLLRGTDWIFK